MSGGPRTVTLEQIEAEIASEHCFTAAEGQAGAVGRPRSDVTHIPAALDLLTFCVLVLKNGHKVVGINYGAIDPTTHSAELGREDARQEARNKVRDYLGFRLRDQIAAEKGTALPAKRYTAADIDLISCTPNYINGGADAHVVMKDGRRFAANFDDLRGQRIEDVQLAGAEAVLRVANGEAP